MWGMLGNVGECEVVWGMLGSVGECEVVLGNVR